MSVVHVPALGTIICSRLSVSKEIRSFDFASRVQLPTKNDSVNAIANIKHETECKFDYDSSDDNMVASIASTTVQVEPKNTTLQIGNKNVDLLIDSGSFCSILNQSLATAIINNSSLARWLTTAPAKERKNFCECAKSCNCSDVDFS